MTQIRLMTEHDVPAVSQLMGDSWRRTYGWEAIPLPFVHADAISGIMRRLSATRNR